MKKVMKKLLALAMVFTMLMPTTAFAAVETSDMMTTTNVYYTDVQPGAWYYDSVIKVSRLGLMNGVGDNKFEPERVLSRAQFATVLWNMEGHPEAAYTNLFDDVSNNEWFTTPVEWAGQNGIISGSAPRQFAPHNPITREQIVTIMYRYADMKGQDVSKRADLSVFWDSYQVQPYAQIAMEWAVAAGIMNGKGNGQLDPRGKVTRAQCATIICNFKLHLEDGDDYLDPGVHECEYTKEIIVKEPTCTEEGQKKFQCSHEGCEKGYMQILPKLDHVMNVSSITRADCTHDGVRTETCKKCNYKRTEIVEKALGHDMSDWVTMKDATCTEDGKMIAKCSRCEHTDKNIVTDVPALGHDMSKKDYKAVWIAYYTCNECKAQFNDEQECLEHSVFDCGGGYSVKEEQVNKFLGYSCSRPNCTHKNYQIPQNIQITPFN